MGKKLWGFIIPIMGTALVLKYLYSNKRKSVEVKRKKRKSVSMPTGNSRVKLNQRQKDIMKLFNRRSILLPSDIYAIEPNISTRTFRRDMTKLVQSGLVVQEGSTKDTRYILKL